MEGVVSVPARAQPKVMRQWLNFISGWLVAGLVSVVVIGASDPLGVHAEWVDGGQGASVENLVIIAWFFFLSVGGIAAFARPRVEIKTEGLILRNILHDVMIPWGRIEEIDSDSAKHLRILAEGDWYTAWGAEKTNLTMLWGRGGISRKIAGSLLDEIPESNVSMHVKVSRRRPEIGELIVIFFWLAYVSLGVAGVSM